MDQEILDAIRAEYTIEQMMVEEDKLRRAAEHLHAAHAVLLTLTGDSDLTNLDEMLEEVDEAREYYRTARRGGDAP